MRVDLAAQLLQPAALHAVLQLQCLGLLAVQLPLDLIFLLQGVHLLRHGVFHAVEGLGQLADLRLLGQWDVRGIELAAADGAGGHDHLGDRRQQLHDHQTGGAAQRHAQRHHHDLHQGDPLAQLRDLGVSSLRIQNGCLQQLQGVLAQVAAADRHLVIVQLRGPCILPAGKAAFQLLQQGAVAAISRFHRTVQHPLLVADVLQAIHIGFDAPQPRVAGGAGCPELFQHFFGLAVFPAVGVQNADGAFHAALKPADGVEVAHLVVLHLLHRPGLIPVQRQLQRKGRKKGRQTQHHALLERNAALPVALFHAKPLPFPFG